MPITNQPQIAPSPPDTMGWLNMYKPAGLSSFQMLSRVRRLCRFTKIGHAGTLDPLAEGILPLAVGQATRIIPYLHRHTKTYLLTIFWGQSTTTDDAEGEVIARSDHRPAKASVIEALPKFVGWIKQQPPRYSALRVNGRRAYAMMRDPAAPSFSLEPRKIHIESIEYQTSLPEGHPPDDHVTLKVVCGSGSYMRALARDLGETLDCPAHMAHLQRTSVGPFCLENSLTYESLCDMVSASKQVPSDVVLSPTVVLDGIPALKVDASEAQHVCHGRAFEITPQRASQCCGDINYHLPDLAIGSVGNSGNEVCVLYCNRLIAIAQLENQRITPKRVFANSILTNEHQD